MRDGVPLKTVKFGERNEDGSVKKGITTSWNEHLAEHWLPFAKVSARVFASTERCAHVVIHAPVHRT